MKSTTECGEPEKKAAWNRRSKPERLEDEKLVDRQQYRQGTQAIRRYKWEEQWGKTNKQTAWERCKGQGEVFKCKMSGQASLKVLES